nr:hypothetical protein [Tanacetum cinerariifolium]
MMENVEGYFLVVMEVKGFEKLVLLVYKVTAVFNKVNAAKSRVTTVVRVSTIGWIKWLEDQDMQVSEQRRYGVSAPALQKKILPCSGLTPDMANAPIEYDVSDLLIGASFRFHPFQYFYPERKLTMEEMLYKFIDEERQEHKEMWRVH